MRRRILRLLPPLAALVVVITAWQLLSSSLSNGRQFLLPPPWDVLTKGLLSRQSADQILPALGRSAELATVGLLIAVMLGMLTGTVLYRFNWLERASFPYLVAMQAIPILAISSLMAVAFGYTFFAKLVIVVMIAFFPIPTSFLLGLKSVDRGLIDLFTLHQVGWLTRFRKLALPSALPQLFTGFRISAGLAVIGAIVGEQSFQAGPPGLGMLLIQYVDYVDYDQVYACLIVSSLLGIVFYVFFTRLSSRIFGSWHASAEHDRQSARRVPR
jgi:NitT/TauT family transport system permease protein